MVYKFIMVAMDESDTSNLALQEAIRLAKDQKAELRVVHVIDESIINSAESYIDYGELWEDYREEGQKFLDKISEKLREANVKFDCLLVELKPLDGRLAEKIVAEAKAWSAELLILGTDDRRNLNHFLLGSVAESVMRIATMPVLLIRGQ